MDTRDLRLVLLNAKHPTPSQRESWKAAYGCWHDVWDDAFVNDIRDRRKLYADEFTRHDECAALFDGDRCAGLVLNSFLDLTLAAHRGDTYFSIWPDEAIRALTRDGSRIVLCSNFTIHFDYRQRKGGLSVKDLLTDLAGRRFLQSGFDGCTGAMRTSKAMNEATYRIGGIPVARDIRHPSGVVVDLVVFYRDLTRATDDVEAARAADDIWDRFLLTNPSTGPGGRAVAPLDPPEVTGAPRQEQTEVAASVDVQREP